MNSYTKTYYMVGPSGSGKTTFIERHRSGVFLTTVLKTPRDTIVNLKYDTNYGMINIKLIETNSSDFKQEVDGFVVFCEYDNCSSTKKTILDIKAKYGDVPIVVCYNKIDKVIPGSQINCNFLREQADGEHAYLTSAKSNYNFEKPFLYLMRRTIANDIQYNDCPTNSPPRLRVVNTAICV